MHYVNIGFIRQTGLHRIVLFFFMRKIANAFGLNYKFKHRCKYFQNCFTPIRFTGIARVRLTVLKYTCINTLKSTR